ncbi:class I SAM-dependent methyltransferase [Cytobacillus kochii]|uniref:class I SAM-dependent methyltransferase n=1 Tax=Cytobacillus kochii TaxID=859143 RepID=UPI0020406CD7|nr:class I SAM-dependent methyltransferase [Cytobacillus kochii]MCM3324804.1 class I SAM-dependent methyltransferase [Cytobacillus kochii]MCM3347197.1 class I SAM-dependent methyltransferase [Cytobacillus kochii]
MTTENDKYNTFINDFYNLKTKDITDTHRDLLWNSEFSQTIRFEYLYKLIEHELDTIEVLDVGCGLSHFRGFINKKKKHNIRYTGLDINKNFIEISRQKYPDSQFINKPLNELNNKNYDYIIASGIFNIGDPTLNMNNYLKYSIEKMFKLSKKGIAFNFLTKKNQNIFEGGSIIYFDPLFVLETSFSLTNKIKFYHSYSNDDCTILMYK